MKEKIMELARVYAGLPEKFDLEEELYYNPEKVKIFRAYIKGADEGIGIALEMLK